MGDTYKSRFTAAQIEAALTIINSISARSGIPCGTGAGSVTLLPLDNAQLSAAGEKIPTSAVVAKAIAAARQVSQMLTYKGTVQTVAELPADAENGWVYIVAEEDYENYAYDGAGWTPIGKLIDPIGLSGASVSYQLSDSGDAVPAGAWQETVPATQKGKYLWTRTVVQFSVGDPITMYSCSYAGTDGTNGSDGKSVTVCGVAPDENGNVALTAGDVGAVPASGGTMTGNLSLPAPSEVAHAVNKAYVDTTAVSLSLPASGWVGSGPYTQTIAVQGLTDGRRAMVYPAYGDDLDTNLAMREACACVSYAKRSGSNVTITCLEDKPAVDVSIIVEMYV